MIEPTTPDALTARAAAGTAGVPLRPSSADLATDALTSYARDYAVRVVVPGLREAGTRSFSVAVDPSAGAVTLRTADDFTPAGAGRTVETAVSAFPSLRPISRRTDAYGAASELTYAEASVSGQFPRELPRGEFGDIALPEPVFDGAFLPVVASLVPFRAGYQGLFETVGEGGPTAIQLTVTEQGTVAGRPVWFVRARPAEGTPTVFAVDAETRQVVRTEIQPAVGVVAHITPADG